MISLFLIPAWALVALLTAVPAIWSYYR